MLWKNISSSLINYRGPGGTTRHAAALRSEGVTVETGHLGELTVDFEIYGWFPSVLPSEEIEESAAEVPVHREV